MVIYVILYADDIGEVGKPSYLVNAVHTAYFTKESAEAEAQKYEEDDRVVEVHPIEIDLFSGIPWERGYLYHGLLYTGFPIRGKKVKAFCNSSISKWRDAD